jgi:hypothetical protein
MRRNPRRALVTLRALLDALRPEPCLAVLQALLRDEPRTQPPLGVGEAVTVVQELTRVVVRGAAGDAPSPFWAPAVGELLELCLAGAVSAGLGLWLCTTAHPLYTGIAKTFGASISETTMRRNPR